MREAKVLQGRAFGSNLSTSPSIHPFFVVRSFVRCCCCCITSRKCNLEWGKKKKKEAKFLLYTRSLSLPPLILQPCRFENKFIKIFFFYFAFPFGLSPPSYLFVKTSSSTLESFSSSSSSSTLRTINKRPSRHGHARWNKTRPKSHSRIFSFQHHFVPTYK